MKVHEGIIHQQGHSFSTPMQVGEGEGGGVPRESPFPEVHSFLTRVLAISGTRQDAPPGRYKSECCGIDCRRPSAALCLREFSTARRRRRVTERGGNPFYIVVDAEEYTTNRGEDFMEQAVAGDFFTDTNIAHPHMYLTGEKAHSRLSRASRNPLLSANQHVAMHPYTFAEERTVYAYARGRRHDETRREGGKVTETMEKKMESEQSPSIGKDSCPIIETTRHRSTENGKRNPDLHAQITLQQWLRPHLHVTELVNYSSRMNKRTCDCAPLSPWSTLSTISDIPRESNEYTETDGRLRGPELRSRAKSVGGAQSTLSQYILCHRVTQNTESSECGPATVDTPGYVDTRTSRANVDERQRLAMEAKSESQAGRNTLRRS
ncbi:hypothetical protein G5I_01317 [Acromyrmex echinatior]|uniref:Uncharacterized protein n=1 Tax=Acromyrmex echinatior TaxID=103372 RepID=F4W7A3_ACREC|nr:hypothetical protein G5I_01317 [Acromyrmex echinatior]